MSRFRTVTRRSRHQPEPIKGSRFLATVAHVETEEEAAAFIAELEAGFPDASHHCWAWHLRDGRYRSSDAGEPGGSAGRPILAQIQGHGLADVAVVVSRWFGGTKLGVGGLVRAYGGAAGEALDRAETVEVMRTEPLVVEHAYDDTSAVQAVIGSEALLVRETEWSEHVRLVLEVPVDRLARVRASIMDRTSGRARLTSGEPRPGEIPTT